PSPPPSPYTTLFRSRVAALAAAAALTLAACGSAPEEEPQSTAGGDDTQGGESVDFTGCIVSDAGGFDDKSFNQLSYEGAKKATRSEEHTSELQSREN